MKQIFLRAENEAELIAALPMFRGDDGWLTQYGKSSLCIIGKLFEGGEYDENGDVTTPPEELPGYHANIVDRDNLNIPENVIIPRPGKQRVRWFGL